MTEENKPEWRRRIAFFTEHRYFTIVIMALIFINAVVVGMETYPELYARYPEWFWFADRLLLWLFTIEIVLRMIAAKPFYHFFRSGWNWFDFLIIAAGHLFAGAHFVTVLRVLRVLRALRAVTVVPSLRRLVDALLRTIPSLFNILFLMGLVFYIFAVIGTMLFAAVSPEYFGNLQRSVLTLFQIVTLDNWTESVMRPIMDIEPLSWIYFVSFVLVGTFIIFNLFIGVIVNNVDRANEEEAPPAKKRDIEALQAEIRALKEMMEKKE